MEPRDTLRVVDPPPSPDASATDEEAGGTDPPADRREATVHGVVLAAGTSSRYGGRNKLVEPVEGTPLVVRATRPVLAADLDGVTVVVGHEADSVREAVAGLEVDVRENEASAEGQSTSVATGVDAARNRGADAVLVALGDMPDVTVGTVELLVRSYRQGVGDAVAAAYGGDRGNPVLFDGRYFGRLTDVDGDVGGRAVLLSDPDAVAVETGDPGVLEDVDRPDDR